MVLKTKKIGIESFLSWFILLFSITCLHLIYIKAVYNQNVTLKNLESGLVNLQSEKQEMKCFQEELSMKVNSQSDPVWIQRTLMRCLGVVPKGQRKVFFDEPSPSK